MKTENFLVCEPEDVFAEVKYNDIIINQKLLLKMKDSFISIIQYQWKKIYFYLTVLKPDIGQETCEVFPILHEYKRDNFFDIEAGWRVGYIDVKNRKIVFAFSGITITYKRDSVLEYVERLSVFMEDNNICGEVFATRIPNRLIQNKQKREITLT